MFRSAKRALALAAVVGAGAGATLALAAPAHADGPRAFVPGVTTTATTVTFPLREGRGPDGRAAWFIVIEASNSSAASTWKVNVVNKLANVGDGAQRGRVVDGRLTFEGGVDFTPEHRVAGTPGTGFPPVVAQPGSTGDAAYSPIVRLPDGSVLNAPQVANASGVHDKVIAIDYTARRVTLALTDGFARADAVRYLSTDASDAGVAALEGSTFAPRLARAPRAGDDSTASGRASLAAFVNGPTGATNPQRQGVNSALLGEGSPLNVLAWTPNQGRYSPLWDVHLSRWADPAAARRITEFAAVEDLAAQGAVTGADGGPWVADDVVVNCPIIVQP